MCQPQAYHFRLHVFMVWGTHREHVVVNFLSLILGMVMYANEVETKEK